MTTLPEIATLKIDEIIPYENNPRRITPEAIEAVRASVERFGYVQPIALHKATREIVVGHTRFQALQKLGVKQVQVYLLDITEQIAGSEARFLMADAGSPTLVRDGADESALYVLMPMRV